MLVQQGHGVGRLGRGVHVEAVQPARTLEDCLVLTGHLLLRTRITIARDFGTSRVAMINRQELQHVLVNLMVNAPGHARGRCADPGHRRLDSGRRPARLAHQGAGTGPGLAVALIGELVKPFVNRKQDGTGLGLWISRSIVERYGGDSVARNRPAGQGSGAVMARCCYLVTRRLGWGERAAWWPHSGAEPAANVTVAVQGAEAAVIWAPTCRPFSRQTAWPVA